MPLNFIPNDYVSIKHRCEQSGKYKFTTPGIAPQIQDEPTVLPGLTNVFIDFSFADVETREFPNHQIIPHLHHARLPQTPYIF